MTPRRRLAFAVYCLAALVACKHETPDEVETHSVVPVKTEAVTVGTVRAVIHASGVVAPAPGADLLVVAPEAGRIAELPKAEGDRVRRGDLLVRFEIPTATSDLASKTAEVARSRARLENAKAAQVRAHDLFQRGVAARKDMEDADREAADADAALAEAHAGQAAAELIVNRTSVRATFDGVVARRTHNPGDQVEPAASDAVLRVIDPHRLEVSALIPVSDVPRVVAGAGGRIVGTADDEADQVKVIARPAVVDTNTATAPVRLSLSGSSRYAVGMPVQVEIDAETHRDVPLVPVRAIVRDGDETAVFVVVDGKAQRRTIELGVADATHVEVRSGVKAGENVIVEGHAGLPDGAAVSVTGT
jgi:RND family efflux transporter MFP subunit